MLQRKVEQSGKFPFMLSFTRYRGTDPSLGQIQSMQAWLDPKENEPEHRLMLILW